MTSLLLKSSQRTSKRKTTNVRSPGIQKFMKQKQKQMLPTVKTVLSHAKLMPSRSTLTKPNQLEMMGTTDAKQGVINNATYNVTNFPSPTPPTSQSTSLSTNTFQLPSVASLLLKSSQKEPKRKTINVTMTSYGIEKFLKKEELKDLAASEFPVSFLPSTVSQSPTISQAGCDDTTDADNAQADSDDSTDTDNDCLLSEQEEIRNDSESYSLPFPNLSRYWYAKEQRLHYNQIYTRTRNVVRKSKPVELDSNKDLLCMNRSQVTGSLEENLETLKAKLTTLPVSSKTAVQYRAICDVGTFIRDKGPLVKTQEVGRTYLESKRLSRKQTSCEYYELFAKHLNLIQIYIFGVAYIMPNTTFNIEHFINTIEETTSKENVLRHLVTERIGDKFKECLQYLDTHRDRQVMKALIAELTSVTFTTKLQGISSRTGTTTAKKTLQSNLQKYSAIRQTSQIVRSDLTNTQQYQLTQRVIARRKLNEIRTISEGRGRKLKSDQFPQLGVAIEYAFGEYDVEAGGGGLEAHPRLTTGTLYKGVDNVTKMSSAREVILSMAPKGFNISLSSCYNYTQNFREGSRQAKQHHSGRGVNANISFKKPPRTGVQELVINLHWSTSNVNSIVNRAESNSHALVISKDAKATVAADIPPVQLPGRSWKKRELPDHTWDQSRQNSITPMTFLFLDTKVTGIQSFNGDNVELVTRTGQGVTLLYLSFFESDTAFKCMNEIFLLLSQPGLDSFFRDSITGTLRKEFVFVVDNGPQEKPANALVQMCMARLLKFLKLDRITQVSFAEYHSKRNFVERVHAEENRVLSKHGSFSSTIVHSNYSTGSKQHRENMEAMADEVCKCLKTAAFGKKGLQCCRGIPEKDFLFDDLESLSNFLSLSEHNKQAVTTVYKVKNCELLNDLHFTWGIDIDFESSYLHDYQLITNQMSTPTAWKDKYTTSLFSPSCVIACPREELQPIPDYFRWLHCCELHYMPWKETNLLEQGPWKEMPGLYLPTKILDLCFSAIPEPPADTFMLIALLAWVTPDEAREYYSKLKQQQNATLDNDRKNADWNNLPLFKNNTKEQLLKLCRELKIPVKPTALKVELVILISEKRGEPTPITVPQKRYTGRQLSIPTSVLAINRLPSSKLREILHYHGFVFIGSKDQLTLKVHLLRHGNTAAITGREEEQIKDLIRVTKLLMLAQRKLQLSSHTYQKRTYSTKVYYHFVDTPAGTTEDNVHELFDPLISYLDQKRQERMDKDKTSLNYGNSSSTTCISDTDIKEQITQVGAKVKVKWSGEDLGDSGWKPGWYAAHVQAYDDETETITVRYQTEPDCLYDIHVPTNLDTETIKLVKAVL